MTTTHRRAPVLDFYREWKKQRRLDRKQKNDRLDEKTDRKATVKERSRRESSKRRREQWARFTGSLRALNERMGFILLVVISASMAFAWSGQYDAAASKGFGALAVLVPLMTEGATLHFAKLAAEAEAAGQPSAKFRISTLVSAVTAAAINFYGHTYLTAAQIAGRSKAEIAALASDAESKAWLFAVASLVGVVVWEATLIARAHRRKGTSAAQRKINRKRLLRNPVISWRAANLRAMVPAYTENDSFAETWKRRKGVPLGEPTAHERRRMRRMAYRLEQADAWDGAPRRPFPRRRQPAEVPVHAPVTAPVPEPGHPLADEVERWLQGGGDGSASPSRTPSPDRPGPVPVTRKSGAVDTSTTRSPLGKDAHSGAERDANRDAPDKVAEDRIERVREMARDIVSSGQPVNPRTLTAAAIRKALGIRRTTAAELRDAVIAEYGNS
ncbi:hypothetical protein ABZZ79_08220 [Streptomyces sp. NPDC006458]|uniref:hypothetical protein n=1 Tax=Streptomyces sp. NPDC006458 TaxID=3154302 RepID=UPI0033A11951